MMKRLRSVADNQAIGLLPVLIFILAENFFPYTISFLFSAFFSIVLYAFWGLRRKGEMYRFVLYSVAVTQLLFLAFLLFGNKTLLDKYASLFMCMLFVLVLTYTMFRRRPLMRKFRNVEMTSDELGFLNASLNEFFFVIQIIQTLFAFHLFVVLFYLILPESEKNPGYEPFLFRHAFLVLGLGLILYEYIRLIIMRGYLRKEVWLPVLNDKGKVIGRIAHSVSAASSRKFYHPVVRVAVVYNGMLYLTKRDQASLVSPGSLDYPFKYYVRFQQSIEDAVYEALSANFPRESVSPRFLIRYKFENETVKSQVSVYVVYLRTEEQLVQCKQAYGKLWTARQIEENLGTGLFSEYFEKEFTYMQNTVLMVENYCCQSDYEVEV